MNHYSIHQSKFSMSEETNKPAVVCPKPRRLGLNPAGLSDPFYMRSVRWHVSQQQEICDSKAGNELLDIILAKGNDNSVSQFASSPPFFSGSPPSRVSNPLIQDSRFGEEKPDPISQLPNPTRFPTGSKAPSPSSARKGGCVRANFGSSPTVRVEGFDCLDRDNRRNHSIPTLA